MAISIERPVNVTKDIGIVLTAPSSQHTKRIIFCDSKKKLEKIFPQKIHTTNYLVLDDIGESSDIKEYLASFDVCNEIDKNQATEVYRPSFKAKYVELLSELNRANHSFFWWAFYFTRKESLYTNFAHVIFECCLIQSVIEKHPSSDLAIVTNNMQLIMTIRKWASTRGFQTITALKRNSNVGGKLKTYVPLRMVHAILKAFGLFILMKAFCRIPVNKKKRYTVIATLLDHRFHADTGPYKDIYFGQLPEYMSKNELPVLVYGGVPLRNSWRILDTLRKQKTPFPIIPWHYYDSGLGLAKAIFWYFLKYVRPIRLKGTSVIDGLEVDHMIKGAIRHDFLSGHFFHSIWMYYSTKALVKKVEVAACVFPYENRSWEKMLISGLSSNGKSIRTVGYHHAAVTPAHTSLMLGRDEAQVIPMPDTIVTMGEVTKQILQESGNYPDGLLRVGCALRQGGGGLPNNRRNRGDPKLLVVLASVADEYVETLLFLEKAFEGVASYQIGIRPHPEFTIEEALSRVGKLKLEFQVMSGPIEDNLDWADVLVYVSSTVGLTAISNGIPAISIDLRKFVQYDPAPPDCPLNWSVRDPQQLIPTLKYIRSISDDDFRILQDQAAEFGKRYFGPVTDESLAAFSELIVNRENV